MRTGDAKAGVFSSTIRKSDDELQIVWGEVYVPGFPDSQGEFMTTDEVRKAAHRFVVKGDMKCIDVNHDGTIYRAQVVESFIARKGDSEFIEGAWVVGVHILDTDLWDRVKKGELNGFSMEALVNSEEATLDLDIPDRLTCVTMKADDGHTHECVIFLDENGQIIGGETDYVDGHRHVIKKGTMTEMADGHRHRYSVLDAVQLAA